MTDHPKRFTPEAGKVYQNRHGGSYLCISGCAGNAHFVNTKSGWTFKAHGCLIYSDGAIEWDYSTAGHFAGA